MDKQEQDEKEDAYSSPWVRVLETSGVDHLLHLKKLPDTSWGDVWVASQNHCLLDSTKQVFTFTCIRKQVLTFIFVVKTSVNIVIHNIVANLSVA